MPSRHLLTVVLLSSALGTCRAGAQNTASSAPAPALIDVKVTGKGLPVVFIPGLATPGSVWDDTVVHFQGDHTCYVVTLAGFGGLPPVPKREHFLADVRDAIIDYLRTRKVAHPVIVGHSLGGVLALEIGIKAPDLPGGVVAVDSLPFLAALMGQGIDTAAQAQAMAAPIEAAFAAQTPAQFAAGQKQFVGGMVTDPAKAAALAARTGKSDPVTTSQAMVELIGRDLRPELGLIKCPVLVLGALADKTDGNRKAADIEAAYRAQYANLPQAKFQFFPQSRHFIMVDDPQGFFDALSNALARPMPETSNGTIVLASPAATRPALDPSDEAKARKEALMAKQVCLACKLYAGDNDGAFPTDLGDLYPTYTQTQDIFLSPFQPPVKTVPAAENAQAFRDFIHASCAYEYFGGKDNGPVSKVLLRSKYPAPDGLRTVVYINCTSGRVQ